MNGIILTTPTNLGQRPVYGAQRDLFERITDQLFVQVDESVASGHGVQSLGWEGRNGRDVDTVATWDENQRLLNECTLVVLESTHSMPATPSTIKSSLVNVPVLSKQQMSILPANGIRNGSVQ